MAFALRRALRVSLTLAAAVAAGFAADSFAADTMPAAGLQPVAATAAPKKVGQESRRGLPVALGHRIASGPGSGIRFTLNDSSTVIIGPNSAATVDEFAADRIVLRLERGSFHVDSASPGTFYVIMPAGTVAIRAATVAGRIGPDGTEVALLSAGRADLTGFAGQSVRLERIGEASRIAGLGNPSQPAVLPPQRLYDFIGLTGQLARLD